MDTTAFPTYSINDDSQGYLFDVDLNGTFDLVMFPLKANVSADIEIYISNRSITDWLSFIKRKFYFHCLNIL